MTIEGIQSDIARIQRIQGAIQGEIRGGRTFAEEVRSSHGKGVSKSTESEGLPPLIMHHQIKSISDVLTSEELSMLHKMFPSSSSLKGLEAYRTHAFRAPGASIAFDV